jgi:hypothetical protein
VDHAVRREDVYALSVKSAVELRARSAGTSIVAQARTGPRTFSPSVLAALAVVIPLGLGGAVSPVMLTEQTVLLAGPDGGRAGVRYAAGVVLTTFVIVVAIVLFGRAISLPTKPHLDATLDLVLGVVLVTVSVLAFVLGRPRVRVAGPQGGTTAGLRVVRAGLGRRFHSECSPWRQTSRRWP